MDIARLSIGLSQMQVQQQVSLSVMKKAIDQAEVGADELSKLMASADVEAIQRAASPHLGGTIDIKI